MIQTPAWEGKGKEHLVISGNFFAKCTGTNFIKVSLAFPIIIFRKLDRMGNIRNLSISKPLECMI